MEEVERATEVADHEHKTYLLMLERIRGEQITYRRDLHKIDAHHVAKQSDASQLQLMVKDATDVRDGARAELSREDERLTDELAALAARLTEKQAKLAAKKQTAAEHAVRHQERCRQLERERTEAIARREQSVSVGSVDAERDEIARIGGVFESISEVIGAGEPSSIIDKFKGQEETYALLASLHRTSRAKIESLCTERDEKRKALEQLRFTRGGGAGSPSLSPSRGGSSRNLLGGSRSSPSLMSATGGSPGGSTSGMDADEREDER